MEGNMLILDSTASSRSIWYQKNNPFTVFMDKRKGKEYACSENISKEKHRIIRIFPDVQAQWQNIPFKNNSFDMVIWDPPHLFRNKDANLSLMSKRYGVFYNDEWKLIIETSVIELFRVLKTQGIFILKWCEVDKDVNEILKLMPYDPMFGTRTGQRNNTYWICFIKHTKNMSLCDFE